jgi:hypothetical protein
MSCTKNPGFSQSSKVFWRGGFFSPARPVIRAASSNLGMMSALLQLELAIDRKIHSGALPLLVMDTEFQLIQDKLLY